MGQSIAKMLGFEGVCMQCGASKELTGFSCESFLCPPCQIKNDAFLEVIERYHRKERNGEDVSDELRLIEEWKSSNKKDV